MLLPMVKLLEIVVEMNVNATNYRAAIVVMEWLTLFEGRCLGVAT
jgi:hypothetical protein